MMKLAVSNIAWEPNELKEHLTLLRDLGCEGVELAPNILWKEPVDATSDERQNMRALIHGAGLSVVGFHALFFTRPDLQFFRDKESLAATTLYLKQLAQLCHDLEGKFLILGSPKSRSPQGRTKQESIEWIAPALRSVAEEGARLGVTLCIEPLPQSDNEFIRNSDEGMELVRRVNHPNFGLHLDAKAMHGAGEDFSQAFGKYGKELKHFHVGDPGLAPPGSTGMLDHGKVGLALRSSGYSGYVSIEMRRRRFTPMVVTKSVEYVRRNYFNWVGSKSTLENVYRIPEDTSLRAGRMLRLNKNERVTSLPSELVHTVIAQLHPDEISTYPEPQLLYQKLSKFLGLSPEHILLSSGSDHGIKSIFETYVASGDEVVTLKPTYEMIFVYTDMMGAKQVPIEYNADFTLPVERVLATMSSHTKLLVIANPNHTGTMISYDELLCIIKEAQRLNVLVLIDEAYNRFSDRKTVVPLVDIYPNLIVAQTFSKAFGLAGLRVGYLVSHPFNIHNLRKVKPISEVSVFAIRFASYMLDHPEVVEQYVREVQEGKAYLLEVCKTLDIKLIPSVTNFVYLRFPSHVNVETLVGVLRERNISVPNPGQGIPIEGLLRVTLGPPAQMQQFIAVVSEYLDSIKGVNMYEQSIASTH